MLKSNQFFPAKGDAHLLTPKVILQVSKIQGLHISHTLALSTYKQLVAWACQRNR